MVTLVQILLLVLVLRFVFRVVRGTKKAKGSRLGKVAIFLAGFGVGRWSARKKS